MHPVKGLLHSWRVVLAAGLVLAAPLARADREDDTYKNLEVFARVLSYVENNYVEPADQRKLMHGAIKGMLETLDPHTLFMPPEVFKEMKIDTSGEFGGLGIEIARKGDRIVVVAPIDDTPAARAGVRPGDELLRIDDETTADKDLAWALQKMRGPGGQAGAAHHHARGLQRASRDRHHPRPHPHRVRRRARSTAASAT